MQTYFNAIVITSGFLFIVCPVRSSAVQTKEFGDFEKVVRLIRKKGLPQKYPPAVLENFGLATKEIIPGTRLYLTNDGGATRYLAALVTTPDDGIEHLLLARMVFSPENKPLESRFFRIDKRGVMRSATMRPPGKPIERLSDKEAGELLKKLTVLWQEYEQAQNSPDKKK